MKAIWIAAATASCLWTMPAAAQPRDRAQAEQVEALLRCRGETDQAARLRCYDEAAGLLQQGIDSGRVVAVDRSRARRSLFGLVLPDFLQGGERDEEELRAIEGVVASVAPTGFQRWQVVLEGGEVWRTSDATRETPPRVGSRVRVERGMLGGYWLEAGSRRFKVTRVR